MSETTKTLSFVGAGLLALVLAVATRPKTAEFQVNSLIGTELTKAVEPEEAKGLKVLEFDEEAATLRDFEVALRDGLWTIPSKGGYPADGQQQMGKAVTGVMDREILDIASKSASDHEQFGVIEPNDKLEVGQKGVGKRVTLTKEDGTPIADYIIGKAVKGADGQRYVRKANQDLVYVVEIDPASFSTKFANWIEPDLLKISPWDLQTVELDNYSASAEMGMGADGRLQMRLIQDKEDRLTLAYDDSKGEWAANKLETYDKAGKAFKTVDLAEGEELNKDKLQELKTALDDLKIVDVERKPEGLSADLKAGEEFVKNEAAMKSLIRHGFVPASTANGVEIISSQGEFLATMKDGVEYILRFGDLQMAEGAEEDAEAPAEGEAPAKEGVNRYLFVMTRFNESAITKPELEELPELPADAPAAEGAKEAAATEASATEPAAEAANAEPPAADAAAETKQPTDDGKSGQPTDEPAVDTPAADAPATESAAAEGEETTAEEASTAEETTEESTEAAAEEKTEEAPKLDEIIAQRKEIEERNQQKLDEYNQKIKAGQKRVTDLNARFGDWYYVISDDVYKKIRLTRADVVQKKAAEEKPAGEAEPDANTSNFGAPGDAVPGIPAVP